MNGNYREEILEIKKEAIEKVNDDVKEVYSQHKEVLGGLLIMLIDLFDRYSKEGRFHANRYEREKILKEVKETIVKETKQLITRDIHISKDALEEIIRKSHEEHMKLWGSRGSTTLTPLFIQEIIFRDYKGSTFNNRIMENKKKLANRLYVEFDKGLKKHATLVELSHSIQETFKRSNYESYRLLMTEQARVFEEVQRNAFLISEMVDRVMWVAALCENTCPYCEMMDGSIFAVDDPNKPEIPAHVFCQCCWVPV
ncbi:minor capsid protein [Natronincola ferrireducens]|uniref:Phage putative head morphogenesis protein, SPP1 gp7 family n=1 Tax=Natronincola ferrireducens TaxID=393762 RepID=A0A1G9IHL3_9FIRM|nr:minor capsid protein [Natronincola ferrireducens]SDL24424.1 phage putative head morphogenesis protein, SPP1 gp7 family [Natronincola ferrireducens]